MTVPACLRLADEVFPRVRAIAARRLVDHGWSQARAGVALGLSQAMVSRHLATREPEDPVALRLADDLVASLVAPRPAGTAHGPSEWCTTLTIGQDRAGGDEALRDLLAAERTLRAGNPLALMPQVGLNVARAVAGARSTEDVLAFPGRLVEAGGRILNPAPPAFGGSGHLARILLARRENPSGATTQALANVRAGRDVLAAAKRLGWSVAAVNRGRSGAAAGEAPVLAAARSSPQAVALHDPGAVGLEPCLYVAGADASDAAARILALHDALVIP
ncbi:MAG TPA: thiamine-phosphate synthase family protein [Candidatus Thermoplasmatota archaeon]|nr:thiamine-phosphate synthase family protein [Candidatus Thermoplasmatota archaeon]